MYQAGYLLQQSPWKTSYGIAQIQHKFYEIDAALKVPAKPVILKF